MTISSPSTPACTKTCRTSCWPTSNCWNSSGPQLGRPRADTLNGSRHPNMKELRFDAADGVWRVAFAFDPSRKAILLVAGGKSGVSKKRFYRQLIEKADQRFGAPVGQIKRQKE